MREQGAALPQILPDGCAVAVRVPDTADGHPSRPQMAADSGMALDASVAMCAGYQSPGGRSFRKQRTVNPLMVPARYNFLYFSSRPALRAASGPAATRRPPGDRLTLAASRMAHADPSADPVAGC